jgi:hypothetical protein
MKNVTARRPRKVVAAVTMNRSTAFAKDEPRRRLRRVATIGSGKVKKPVLPDYSLEMGETKFVSKLGPSLKFLSFDE